MSSFVNNFVALCILVINFLCAGMAGDYVFQGVGLHPVLAVLAATICTFGLIAGLKHYNTMEAESDKGLVWPELH